MTTTPTAWSGEVIVANDPTAFGSRITALSDGTFALSWQNSSDIFGRHLNELGSFTGSNFLSTISDDAPLRLSTPIVIDRPDGNLSIYYGVDGTGSASGSDILSVVTDRTLGTSTHVFATALTDNDERLLDGTSRVSPGGNVAGGGAVVYELTNTQNVTNIAIQLTSIDGTAFESLRLIDADATRQESDPALVGLHTGLVAVAYTSSNAQFSSRDIRLRYYAPDGSTGDFGVSASADNVIASFPDVTELRDGTVVVVWQQVGGIAFRTFFGNVTPINDSPTIIPTSATGLLAKVAPLNDGGFVVAWSQADGNEGDGSDEYDLYLQRYDRDGKAVGDRVHIDEAGDQTFGMEITTLSDGRVVMTYETETGDSTDLTNVAYQIFDPRELTIDGTNRNDNIVGRREGSVISGFDGDDKLTGMAGDDILNGQLGQDNLIGQDGNDRLNGALGNDSLDGGAGSDRLYGGVGADTLTGGDSADVFHFNTTGDSSPDAAGRDVIVDFKHSQGDRIDIHHIDADTHKRGNQAFEFIGENRFHHHEGDLRVSHKDGDTFVIGDVDGDRRADFTVKIEGDAHLRAGDFLL